MRLKLTVQQKARIVESIITILVGFVLFIGNRRLTEFAMNVRAYGRTLPISKPLREDDD